MSTHTELSTDSKPLSDPSRLLAGKSEMSCQRPAHAKVPDDNRTETGPHFGMTVSPVAERREHPRSEHLTSAVFEV